MRFCTTPRSVIITVAGLFMAATFAEAKPFRRSLLSGDDDDAGYEWSGVFATEANEHTWLMQANSTGQYPDKTMKLVIFALDATPTYDNAAATLTSKVNTAVTLMASTCTNLTAGGTITPQSAGGCVNLVTGTTEDSSWTIVTTNVKGLAIFAEHVPIEFERDTHFLRAGTVDIECKAEKSPGGGGHDHAHGDEEEEEEKESCACAAGRLGFSIDCTNQAAITAAITYLSTHGVCSSCAPTDECKKQFAILQTHHDYCHHEEIPEAAEHEIHDFEAFYEGCTIKRRYDPQLATVRPVFARRPRQTFRPRRSWTPLTVTMTAAPQPARATSRIFSGLMTTANTMRSNSFTRQPFMIWRRHATRTFRLACATLLLKPS